MENTTYFIDEDQKRHFFVKQLISSDDQEKPTYFSIKDYPDQEFQHLINKYSLEKISDLKLQFSFIFSIYDPNLAYNYFIEILSNNFITKPKSVKIVKKLTPPWITNGIKKAILISNKLFRNKKNIFLAK